MLGPPPTCPGSLYELMLGCWKRNPDDRFTFNGIRERLQGLIDREKASGEVPRDIGHTVNKLLTADFQRASMQASRKRRASRKVRCPPFHGRTRLACLTRVLRKRSAAVPSVVLHR